MRRILDLLNKLDNPHNRLPPVIHVAGTNGKGSVIAFMRSICEAGGLKVHVYTSPHLVKFNERIVIAGNQVDNKTLVAAIKECIDINDGYPITSFEMTTAAAFLLFSRFSADLVLLETGLGGRLDATNVISKPLATVLTPISFDHEALLGTTLKEIAVEKIGIMREGIKMVVSRQENNVRQIIQRSAKQRRVPCLYQGRDWVFEVNDNKFSIETTSRIVKLPYPGLVGEHQFQNAAQAISCLDATDKFSFKEQIIKDGVSRVKWPGRLQKLSYGPLVKILPVGWEIWLDGGHNVAAGLALAKQALLWEDKPLFCIIGMIKSKNPGKFLSSFCASLSGIIAVEIENEPSSMTSEELKKVINERGLNSESGESVEGAINAITRNNARPGRILICGSLYLIGQILSLNH